VINGERSLNFRGERNGDNNVCSTYADLSFVTWDMMVPWIFGDEAGSLEIEKNYPSYHAWNQRLMQRPSVQKIGQDKQKAMSGK
jgi:glutathione S-transferase